MCLPTWQGSCPPEVVHTAYARCGQRSKVLGEEPGAQETKLSCHQGALMRQKTMGNN